MVRMSQSRGGGAGRDVRTAAKAPSVGWHEGAVYLRVRSEIKVENIAANYEPAWIKSL